MIKHTIVIITLCLLLVGLGFIIGLTGKTGATHNPFLCKEGYAISEAPF